ncbi:MAG: leucine-rich repeat protein, partial [Clostridia bacterium]|nr:leucine-rich repeat protein [Clostridia bacterium]
HSTGGTVIYKQTISKTADETEKNHTINYVSEFESAFKTAFEDAWAKVCDEKVVTVDIYKVDKDTDTDFTSLATSSTADAIGIVLTGDGLTNINKKLAEIYALHNDVNSKVWVIENDGTLNGENAAITLDACINSGDRPTGDASFALYGADGVKGQSFVLTANEPHALIPSPLWISGQGILTTAENITFEGGLLSSTGEDGSISFSAPAVSATFESVGVGDAEDYGNIESVGLWIYKDEKLTIKGAGAMPDYASTAETPWKGKAITEIEITEGVTSIGAYAFAEFDATVNIPKSVTAIATTAINKGSTIVSYDNAYANEFASTNSFTFTNLGGFGTIGADLYWHLDTETGLFTVTGTGTDLYAQDDDGNKFYPAVDPWTGGNWSTVQYYEYRNAITKIVIEAPIKSIQDYCFTFLDKCTTVELPESYTGMNSIAFHGLNTLTCLYTTGQTPEPGIANLSNFTSIGNYALTYAPFTKIIFNDSVKTIGTKVFYKCEKLTELDLPESLATIGDNAFALCTGLTSLTLPESVTSVHANAFQSSTNIATLTVKNSSLEIADFAANLTGLKLIVAPEGSPAHDYAVEKGITFEAYEEVIASGECGTDLYWKLVDENGTGVLKIYGTGTTVDIGMPGWPDNTAISTYSPWYNYYSQITKIEFCDSVTTVNKFTFYGMKALKTVELTQNLKTIAQGAFAGCSTLSTMYVKGTTPTVGTYDLSYVADLSGGYQFDSSGFSGVNNIILGDALSGAVGDKAFAYLDSITSLTFPEGVTKVGYRTVHRNKKLTTLTFLNKDTVIPDNFLLDTAEENVTPLETVYGYKESTAEAWVAIANQYYVDNAIDREITFVALKEAVATGKAGENLEWKIVEETDGTHTMTIYGTGTKIQPYITKTGTYETSGAYGRDHSIYDWAQYYSTVKKIIIEAPVTDMVGYTFNDFDKVTTIELPTSMTKAPSSGFNDMEGLKTLYTIGQTPEEGVANLTNFTTIDSFAFVKCAFEEIIFPENIKIEGNSFVWCTKLKSVEIPEGATVASSAFRGYANNNSLVSVTYPASFDTVVYSPFTVYGADDASNANNYITTITVKNPDAAFEGITDGDYSVFLTKLSALTTVYGYTGSTAETFVECANEYFDTNSIDRTLTFIALEESDENVVVKDMPIGDNLWYRLLLNENGETYTMDIYGEGANCYGADSDGNKVTVSYNITGTDRSYYEDRAKIVKLKISAPNITSFADYMFQDIAIETI